MQESELEKILKKNRPSDNKVIFHIDVNSAYLSWTAVELLKTSDIDIRKIPAVIGGDETKRSGVVLAKSIPATNMGVKTGEPIYFALKKVPKLKMFPSNFSLYEEKSQEFNNLLYKYTAIVEKYSIDESFLDVTDYLLGKTPLELAEEIKTDIFKNLGFTVNIGISNSKMLAKTASDFKKPNMIHTLYINEIKDKLWPLDISFLFSVGKKTQNLLRKLQIHTIKDLAETKPENLEKVLGKNGVELWKIANGIDHSNVLAVSEKPKSISHAETLPSNINDIDLIKNQIIKLTEKASNRLREEKLCTKTVKLTLRDKNFKDNSKQKSFKTFTDNTSKIYHLLIEILNEIYNDEELRLIGVSLDNLNDKKEEQLDLFSLDNKNQKQKKRKPCIHVEEKEIDVVLDDINKKYGNSIKRARNIKNQDKDNN